MKTTSVVVLGGGLSGVAAAYTLARSGIREVTVLESGASLGGLAGSFEREGHFYPLGYHHILHRDGTLLFFLQLIGALRDVRWRRIRMLFHLGGEAYDLGSPGGFLRFPMSLADKARFVRLMATAFAKRDWSAWQDRSAAELIDECAGPGVREALFERLTRLKFELPCAQVSGAWLGARLHFREGSAPLGYIPKANWTKVLCDGVARLLTDAGVRVRLRTRVTRLHTAPGRVTEAELDGGERIAADRFVSTVPTEVYLRLVPEDANSRAGSDTVLRLALGNLRHPAGGTAGRLLEQPGIAGPDRGRHLPAQLAQSHDRAARRYLRQLRDPPAGARPAAVPGVRRAAHGALPARLPRGVWLRRWSHSGSTWPGSRCIRPSSAGASGTRRSEATPGRTSISRGTIAPSPRSFRPGRHCAPGSRPAGHWWRIWEVGAILPVPSRGSG